MALALAYPRAFNLRRDPDAVEWYTRARDYAVEKKLPMWAVGAISKIAGARAEREEFEAASALRAEMAPYKAMGAKIYRVIGMTYETDWQARMGNFDTSLAFFEEGIRMMDEIGERWYEAEHYRVRGNLSVRMNDGAEAESWYLRALEVSRRQQAKSWELRAATSLARLWHSQGKTAEASDLLAPVYNWFTEGFDTRDLRDAKALLEEFG